MIDLDDDIGEHTSLVAIPHRPTRPSPPLSAQPLRPYYVLHGQAGAYMVCAPTRELLEAVVMARSSQPAQVLPAMVRPLSIDEAGQIAGDIALAAAGASR